MDTIIGEKDYVFCYIDNILVVIHECFEDYISKLEKVLEICCRNNLQIHIKEIFIAAQRFDYLGYYLTPFGIKPQERKVKAILNITYPKNK